MIDPGSFLLRASFSGRDDDIDNWKLGARLAAGLTVPVSQDFDKGRRFSGFKKRQRRGEDAVDSRWGWKDNALGS